MALRVIAAEQSDYRATRGAVADAARPAAPSIVDDPDEDAFLRIPPFPGARVCQFETRTGSISKGDENAAEIVDLIMAQRIGGTYWAAQPDLPPRFALARTAAAADFARQMGDYPVVLWLASPHEETSIADQIVVGDSDPWHMLDGATALVTEEGDAVAAIASILDIATYVSDDGSERFKPLGLDPTRVVDEILPGETLLLNPFSSEPMSVHQAIELCGYWRRLIDSNRGIAGGLGFAFWKQDNVASLLWDGSRPFAFLKAVPEMGQAPVAVWGAKTPPELLTQLERDAVPLIEVEDGFLRSQGLGADCVPPLSLTVDRLGPYFDHRAPSELELLLEHGPFDDQLLDRAARLRAVIVEAGLGKYERGIAAIDRPASDRRHILVAGQVEDDRSVQTGGCGLSNLELLTRVRAQAPDAYIVYKPHPDVVAGHRKGAIDDKLCLRQADQIVTNAPISSLIAMVDEVHVNTSLTGFEALLRDKPVTTYGVPFYAGWGLTRDFGPVPARRTARRSLDELVAATLLLYPRYLDPVTNLPCPAEIVVDRLSAGATPDTGLVVATRRLQGQLMRSFRRLVS